MQLVTVGMSAGRCPVWGRFPTRISLKSGNLIANLYLPMSCCPLVVQWPVGNRGSFLAGRLLLHDQYELHSQITEPVRLFSIRVKTMLCFFYPQFPTSLYYFPLHLLLRLLCFPHSPPPSLHHLLLLLLFVTSSFVSSCDSTHLCPPPFPQQPANFLG